jgi:hypothetical protein
MSFVTAALIGAGGALVGGLISSSGQRQAASTQADAARSSADLQYQMFQEQNRLQEPFRNVGLRALNKLEGASDYTPFGMGQFQADPGYAFRLSEGQKALDRQAAARGGLMSGGALKAAQRYGQEMGSQEYTNAFNRYQTERNARLNPLQSLAGVGQTATNQLAQAGQNYGANAGNAYTAAGNAIAAGQLGVGNTFSNAINAGTSAYTNANTMNALFNRGGGYNYTYAQPWAVGPQQIG